MKIMIDPGHRNNAHDFGASGNGLKESAIALAISKKLKKDFEAAGHTVFLTRSSENETITINERPYGRQPRSLSLASWILPVQLHSL